MQIENSIKLKVEQQKTCSPVLAETNAKMQLFIYQSPSYYSYDTISDLSLRL